jgi:hypothetical protein
MQGFKFTSGGPPEDPILQALSAGMAEYRNESMRLFSKLVKLGQGIHLPHLLVDEMRAMAQDAGANGGAHMYPASLTVHLERWRSADIMHSLASQATSSRTPSAATNAG